MKSTKFIYIKANEHSINSRKTVHGIGINDAWYKTNIKIDGNRLSCIYYNTWKHMIGRVYDPKYNRRRAYEGTTICDEWHTFSNFKKWMETQSFEGKHLDKDILYPKNKRYSPDNCVFVLPAVNSLLTTSKHSRGKYPIGVNLHKKMNKYNSNIRRHNKLYFLGYYDTPEEAHNVYLKAKIEYIKTFFDDLDEKIVSGLNRHIQIMETKIAILSNK